jgi:eukaryotic-like serine/threonine-protein kinase
MSEHDLFIAAVQMTDPTARAAYLDKACAGDTTLRQRVEVLLRAYDSASSFLDQPDNPGGTGLFVPNPDAAAALPLETCGAMVGRYKLLQQLGEGGMGTVFLAQQQEPIHRQVALKIIKAGMDSKQVVSRFEAERQALALMDHPNIAKVLDGGTTQTGRPYFVMELVKGIPITKYCDHERLSPQERLALFLPVCQAVQHAHQKGIIHRDLKPSNVLIGLYDGKPIPKVIDFGVAKATQQQLTERTMFTEVGQIVGTLEYMAPEQAELNNLDIDTRADIYSLGVLLYELLTGSPPFTAKQLRSAAFTEMLRIIREVEPSKPSTKLSSSAELPGIAAKRQLEPKKLTKLLQGELDWIVMKCLEKERGRRYETANAVSLDLQRYLADEPVLAGPPSRAYRLRKFLHRHRGPVLAAAVLLLALVAGITGTTLGLLRVNEARQAEADQRRQAEQAGAAERQAKLEAQAAAVAETKANAVAQQRLLQITKANDILASIFRDLNPRLEEKGGPPLLAQLGARLDQAAELLEGQAVGDALMVARLQMTLGLTQLDVGYADKAIKLFDKARRVFVA